jgi:hypothetical protein
MPTDCSLELLWMFKELLAQFKDQQPKRNREKLLPPVRLP